MKKGALPAFFVLFPLFAGGAPAHAQSRAQSRGASALPLDRLLPEIRRSHPGQIYDAEGPERGANGELQYRLKWMTPDGRIVWFDADARTGRVLGSTVPPSSFSGGGRAYEPSSRYATPPPSYSSPPSYAPAERDRFGGPPAFGHDEGRYGTPYSGRERPSDRRYGGGDYGGGGHGGGGRERSRRR